jgi:hypothetical protein
MAMTEVNVTEITTINALAIKSPMVKATTSKELATLVLLGTQGCHLCDTAEGLLKQASAARALQWECRDIALDDELVNRYGERIPVLLLSDGRELGWPFSLLDILSLAK